MEVLFKTIHGSRLYGLSHENSDYDYYVVVDKMDRLKSQHEIVDDVDTTTVDLGMWIDQCQRGTPQALEAMFSEKPDVDNVPDLRRDFKAGSHSFFTFLRVIKSLQGWDDFKHKRHMIRLAYEAQDLARYGRFNPTMTPLRIETANELAKLPLNYCLDDALTIAFM
jgi:predicted nucleotidyltransferase